MKSLAIILILQVLNTFCFGQSQKEKQFETAIQEVVNAFSKQNGETIAKYINKNIGLYQLDRVGVFDHYNRFTAICFTDTTYPQILFRRAKGVQSFSIKYAKLPKWDCGKQVWSKKGLFVDTTTTDHLLSEICKARNKYRPDTISAKTIQYFYSLENDSRRVVLYDNNGIELVFYLTYYHEKWFFTIIDNVSSDCSV